MLHLMWLGEENWLCFVTVWYFLVIPLYIHLIQLWQQIQLENLYSKISQSVIEEGETLQCVLSDGGKKNGEMRWWCQKDPDTTLFPILPGRCVPADDPLSCRYRPFKGVAQSTVQKSKGSLEEPNNLQILASRITKVVHYYSSDRLEVESAAGWKNKMMKKGWEDEWIATVKERRVYNLSLNLSLMDGWKEEMRGVMMKTGELWVSPFPWCILYVWRERGWLNDSEISLLCHSHLDCFDLMAW